MAYHALTINNLPGFQGTKTTSGTYSSKDYGAQAISAESVGSGPSGPAPTPTIKVWDWDTSTWVLQPAT